MTNIVTINNVHVLRCYYFTHKVYGFFNQLTKSADVEA